MVKSMREKIRNMENLRDCLGMAEEQLCILHLEKLYPLPHQPQQSYLLLDGIIHRLLAAYRRTQDLILFLYYYSWLVNCTELKPDDT